MIKLLFLLLIIINVNAFDVFSNGHLIIGNDGNASNIMQDSVDSDTGLLRQPWYEDNATWYKLTYNNYGLSFGMSFNNEKVFTGGSKRTTELEYIIPLSVETNASLISGFGTLGSKATFTEFNTSGYEIEVKNIYELKEDKSFIKVTTSVTNKSGKSVSDFNVWVGTQDDYVGEDDGPFKERGNFDSNNSFIGISNALEQSKVLKITSTTDNNSISDSGSSIGSTVLFYTVDDRAYMTLSNYSFNSFIPLMNQEPQTADINRSADGSYGMKVILEDIADNESKTFTWYYIAGSVSEISNIIDEVIEDTNEAPTDITLSNTSINENLAPRTVVGELGVADVELDDTHTYSFTCNIAGTNDGEFSIDAILLKIDTQADFETKSTYDICIRVTDSASNEFDKNFTISINDLSDTPSIDDCNADGLIPNVGLFDDCNIDADIDGFTALNGDCNDNNVDINPNGVEIPNNGIDEDCSGDDLIADEDRDGFTPLDGDCNDNNSSIYPGAIELPNNAIDEDCSGEDFIDESLLDRDADGYRPVDGDCNDFNSAINPGATEIPNNSVDEDCSGEDEVNEALIDADGDGYTVAQGDCNDFNKAINPGIRETPNNGVDEDCSGADLINDSVTNEDKDHDGFTTVGGDCDDSNAAIYPGAMELPNNGIDEDCSGADWIDGGGDIDDIDSGGTGSDTEDDDSVGGGGSSGSDDDTGDSTAGSGGSDDSIVDGDGDGYTPADGDCNDYNSAINPSIAEISNNGIDEDCTGTDQYDPSIIDGDGDGYTPSQGDCNDYNSVIYPNAIEIPNNNVDEDCFAGDLIDGSIIPEDTDGDGFVPNDGDCNDEDSTINPNATDISNNGIDEDCSGKDTIDPSTIDSDGDGYTPADGDCNDYNSAIYPNAIDILNNGIDEDCLDGDSEDIDDYTPVLNICSLIVFPQLEHIQILNSSFDEILIQNSEDDAPLSISFLHINSDTVVDARVQEDGVLNYSVSKAEVVSTATTDLINSKIILTQNSSLQLVSKTIRNGTQVELISQTDVYGRQLQLISYVDALSNEKINTIVGSSLNNSTTTVSSNGILTLSKESGCGIKFNVIAASDSQGEIQTSFELLNPSSEKVVSVYSTLERGSAFEAGSTITMDKVFTLEIVLSQIR